MRALSKEITRYVRERVAAGEDIVHASAADEFIAAHEWLISQATTELIRKQIANAIKKCTQAPAPPAGQGVLFAGFPAAVTIQDGVTRPIWRCTRADLAVGRRQKVDNIDAAKQALAAYDMDLDRVLPHMSDDQVTVQDVASLLAETDGARSRKSA